MGNTPSTSGVLAQMCWGARGPLVTGVVRQVARIALLAWSTACTPTRAPAEPATPSAELATLLYEATHSCQPPLPSTNTEERASELFVELALLDVPNQLGNIRPTELAQLTREPDVRLLGSPHIISKLDETTTVNFDQRYGVLDQVMLARVSLIARPSESNHHVFEFELGFYLPNPDPTQSPQITSTTFLAEGAFDRALVSSTAYPRHPERQVLAIVKAHPVRGPDDLRAIFECKMRLHRNALTQP